MNDHKITLDDPRLTTYALGELDDANERRVIENALALDPELRAYVHEIQSLGLTLQEGFAQESTPSLARSVEKATEPDKKPSAWRYAWPLGLAASVALVFALQTQPWNATERIAESAQPDTRTESSEAEVSMSRSHSKLHNTEITYTVNKSRGSQPKVHPERNAWSTNLNMTNQSMANFDGIAESSDASTLPFALNSTENDLFGSNGGSAVYEWFDRESTRDRYARHRPAPEVTQPQRSTESYAHTKDNAFKKIINPGDERSTFSTDVDAASYANIRRFLTQGQRPPRDAVRIEEMINYFDYDYPNPAEEKGPFTMNLEVNEAPWTPGHRLLRIGLKAKDMMVDRRPDSNLVS